MPCYYTGSAEGDARLSEQEAHTETTKITDMLCRTLKAIEDRELEPDLLLIQLLPKDVQRWWKEHKKLDKRATADAIEFKKREIERVEKKLADLKQSLKKLKQ